MVTFKDIEKANGTIKTTPIKGKSYAEVNQRIKAFRMLYPEGYIRSEIIEADTAAGYVLMKATVGYYDETGADKILGVGTSFEWKNDPKSMVNKTSYIENCETSAVGRALGMIGLGIDVAIASADEVNYAIAHQEEMQNETVSETPAITCKVCGNPIKAHVDSKTGKEASPKKIADQTKKQFGKIMCWDCAHKAQEKINAAKAVEDKMKVDPELQLPFPITE